MKNPERLIAPFEWIGQYCWRIRTELTALEKLLADSRLVTEAQIQLVQDLAAIYADETQAIHGKTDLAIFRKLLHDLASAASDL